MRLVRLAVPAALAATSAFAQPRDLVAEGREIAETWCANCHAVGAEQASAMDAAPGFPALADDPLVTDAGLAAWIADPQHPEMPNPGLGRAQIEAVIAYIRSLRASARD